jgi:hypothetical protein
MMSIPSFTTKDNDILQALGLFPSSLQFLFNRVHILITIRERYRIISTKLLPQVLELRSPVIECLL